MLSAIIKCPVCGAGMYGNVNRKKKADGEYYKEYYYYACKHRSMVTGHPCTYNKQWSEEKIDAAVVEIIKKLTANPKFEKAIREKIDASIDTSAFETEIDNLRKQLKQTNGAKNKLAQQMDILDITDPQYDRKYSDMQYRLNAFYDTIEDIESRISEVEFKIETIKSDKIKSDSIYKYLLHFDKFYDEMTDKEKKIFMNSFLKSVEIYEDERCDGRILKSLGFRFPIFSEDGEIVGASWDNESSVESVVLLSQQKPKFTVDVDIDLDELDATSAETKATYDEIKEYVLKKYGLKVSCLYIAQIKQKHGIIERENYNKPKNPNSKQPQCPPEKEKAITEALKYFKMI